MVLYMKLWIAIDKRRNNYIEFKGNTYNFYYIIPCGFKTKQALLKYLAEKEFYYIKRIDI